MDVPTQLKRLVFELRAGEVLELCQGWIEMDKKQLKMFLLLLTTKADVKKGNVCWWSLCFQVLKICINE